MERRLLALACEALREEDVFVAAAAEAVLLVEYEGDHPLEARQAAAELAYQLQFQERLAFFAHTATDARDIDRCWQLREAALPSLYSLRGGSQPRAFIEDVGVPPEE